MPRSIPWLLREVARGFQRETRSVCHGTRGGFGGNEDSERVLYGRGLPLRRGSEFDEIMSVRTWTRYALRMVPEPPTRSRATLGLRSLS
jgi:hypothetical protein